MSNPRLEIQAGGRRRIYQILDEEVRVGSGEDVDLRVVAPGVMKRHVRLRRFGKSFRVEPVRRSDTVVVNGEEVLLKDLTHGDAIELGDATLVYLDRGAAASVAPISSEVRTGARQRAAARHRREGPNWILLATVIAIGTGALVLAVRACSSSTWPRSPAHYLDLAREQLARGAREQALSTLEVVLGEATGDVYQEALQLQQRIRDQLQEAASLPALEAAGRELSAIGDFETWYLRRDPSHRPAAREIVRLLERWFERHGEVVERTEAGRRLLAEARELRQRYGAAAQLGSPESEEDVLFAAERQRRLDPRGYVEALRRLDAFLDAHPDNERVTRFRNEMLEEGEEWLGNRLHLVDQLLERDRESDAKEELRKLERFSVLPQWQAMVDERWKRIGG